MSTRLVLDELDVNLPPLTSRLVIVVVVVIGRGTHTRTLDAASVGAVAVVGRVEARRMSVGVGDVGHCKLRRWRHGERRAVDFCELAVPGTWI